MLQNAGWVGSTKILYMPTPEEAVQSGRLKYVRVSYWWLLELLRQGHNGRFVKVEGLPDDALIVGFSEHAYFTQQQIAIKVWSASFPTVLEGSTTPELVLKCSLYEEEQEPEEPTKDDSSSKPDVQPDNGQRGYKYL